MSLSGLPEKQGLYDPRFEHDACGVGFVVNIKGQKSHEIVEQALTVLENLDHRGACGCEENTGDGAGILMQVPHAFLKEACAGLGFQLPEPGDYGVGMIFLPDHREQRPRFEKIIESIVKEEGQQCLGWRTVPTDNLYLGDTAKATEPFVRQVFIGRSADLKDDLAFERKLYVIRRRAENAIRYARLPGGDLFYVASLSSRTLIYKGMLTPRQVSTFYPDLTGFVLELAVWDPDVSQRALCADLANMDPDTEPMLLSRVNFGTPDEVAVLVEMALPTKSVALDISGTKASTRRAFRDAFVARGIEMMKVVSE